MNAKRFRKVVEAGEIETPKQQQVRLIESTYSFLYII